LRDLRDLHVFLVPFYFCLLSFEKSPLPKDTPILPLGRDKRRDKKAGFCVTKTEIDKRMGKTGIIRLFDGMVGEGVMLPKSQAARMLLALLLLARGKPCERSRLAGTLWPDTEESLGLFYLRRTLSELRACVTVENATKTAVVIATENIACDVWAFDDAIKAEKWAEAVGCCQGSFLAGYDTEWVLPERAIYEERLLAALERAATESVAMPAEAIAFLRRAIAIGPYRESAVRRLMQLLATQGNHAEATQAFRDLRRRLLEARLGEPSPETQNVAISLRQFASATVPSVPLPKISPLPTPLTRFFGREEERDQLRRYMATSNITGTRLITLTGPGGIGKTRLALEVAAEWTPCFFAPLAEVTQASRLTETLWQILSSHERTTDAWASLISLLSASPQTLLILDNFEQLASEEGVAFIRHLLESVPTLICVVTSRKRLGLPGEHLLTLRPLSTPLQPGTPTRLEEFPAMQLLCDRARALRSDFVITNENTEALATLCRQAEGIPLALELLAAHLRSISPEQLVRHIAPSSAKTLQITNLSLPERHQSVWNAIESTMRLLTSEEQHIFRTLSVFRGGWTIEAAQAVCALPDSLSTLLLLEKLEDFSLINTTNYRFMMLETLREYAQATLSASERESERLSAEAAHQAYFLAFTERRETDFVGPKQREATQELDADWENIRVAFDACSPAEKVEMAIYVALYIQIRPLYLGFMEQALMIITSDIPAIITSDIPAERQARLHSRVGTLQAQLHRWEVGEANLNRALDIYRQIGNVRGIAATLSNRGAIALDRHHYALAEQLLDEAIVYHEEAKDQRAVAITLSNRGLIALRQGDLVSAAQYFQQCIPIREAMGDTRGRAIARLNLASVLLLQGDGEKALAYDQQSLQDAHDLNDWLLAASALDGLACAYTLQEDFSFAAQLFGLSQQQRDNVGMTDTPSWEETIAPFRARTQSHLGEREYASQFADGGHLALETVLERQAEHKTPTKHATK
jgi:predicted ATPase/DNA-binding SARP family transcriptional activator